MVEIHERPAIVATYSNEKRKNARIFAEIPPRPVVI